MGSNSTHARPRRALLAVLGVLVLGVLVIAAILALPLTRAGSGPAESTGTAFPLKVDSGLSRLVDQNNKPFLYTADTSWSLLNSLTVTDAKAYIDVRKAQGFNTIQTNIVFPERSNGGPHGAPFVNGTMSERNEEYFRAVDQIIAYAGSQDMQLVIGTLWMGFNGGKYCCSLPSTAEFRSYGSFLGERYKNTPNIMWFVGGDDTPYRNMDAIRTLATTLKAADPHHLITYHTDSSAYDVSGESWLGFNSFQWNANSAPYPYADVRAGALRGKPVLDIEPAYEPTPCCGADMNTTPQKNRRSGWWAMLSGALGVVYGSSRATTEYVTSSGLNVSDINRQPPLQSAYIRKILEQYEWSALVPDWSSSVVTDGRGSYGGDDYVTAGRARDGSLIAAYTPTSRTLSVDVSTLAGDGVAYWYDPTTGTKTGSGTAVTNSGTQTFSTPGSNAGGDSDWVLIITAG